MRPTTITPENAPKEPPVIIRGHHFCRNWDCFTERVELAECGKIPFSSITYQPILKCPLCERLYFGTPLPIPSPYYKIAEAREAEHKELIRRDEEATLAEIHEAEAKAREQEQAEIDKHEAELSGDIILPSILTV